MPLHDVVAAVQAMDRYDFDLNWQIVGACGFEVTKNGRGFVMREPGASRWCSMLRPLYFVQDALALIRHCLPGWIIDLSVYPDHAVAALSPHARASRTGYHGRDACHALSLALVQALRPSART